MSKLNTPSNVTGQKHKFRCVKPVQNVVFMMNGIPPASSAQKSMGKIRRRDARREEDFLLFIYMGNLSTVHFCYLPDFFTTPPGKLLRDQSKFSTSLARL